MADFDIAIVGSGFGGSLLAMIARRLGRSVILIERGTHPRFAIGESTSPLTNLLIEQIAMRYELPRLLPLTAWGPWQRTYPEIAGGMKRGFTYYHHEAGKPFARDPERRNQLLVSASPNDEIADTHWFRADVDHFLLREAVSLGAEYVDHTALSSVDWSTGPATLQGDRRNEPVRLSARLVIDATGPRGFLSRALAIPESDFERYPRTQTLFSHFTGVRRTDEMGAFRVGGEPPYRHDDSALHHVFDGGWMWVLRFNNGVTSAGIAVEERLGQELNLLEGEAAWGRFLARYPSIAEQFEGAQPVRDFVYSPRLTYRATQVAGPGWAMLPSAAAFVDPLFSTGIPLTLLGIERLGRILADSELGGGLEEYAAATMQEVEWAARLVSASYAAFPDFPTFAALSMFYFAAASYSEMARRLGKPKLVQRFLAADRPDFAPAMAACEDSIHAGATDELERRAAAGISPLNVAGLADRSKRNWYGVDLQDVVNGAEKLGFTPPEMRRILDTAPWAKAACRS
jgi:FADH2 O2-dependent halogenase